MKSSRRIVERSSQLSTIEAFNLRDILTHQQLQVQLIAARSIR